MTTDTHFGTYSAAEVEAMIAEAVEEERAVHLGALVVLSLPTFLLGLALGWWLG